MKIGGLIPVLLFLLLIGPAAALTVEAAGVSSYSIAAEEGMVIYQITVNDLPIGTNQTHTLNVGGSSYLLEIGTYDEWGYKNADVTLTYPNGTSQTDHVSALALLVNAYKTNIQYVFPQIYSGSGYFTIDLVLGLTPVSASFNGGAQGWHPSNSLAFTSASGNVGGVTTIYVEQMTKKEFKENVVNYNPIHGITNLGSQVFQWSWSGVLGFISMIPVIGPVMVSLIDLMGGAISTGWYWLHFVVVNFPAVLAGVECLILMMAVINAGSGKSQFKKLASNLYQYNLAFALGVIGLVNIVWGWTKSAIETVAAIIQALKPI